MKTSEKAIAKQEAIDSLFNMISPGVKIYTQVRHVSKSGMSRAISCYIIMDNSIVCIDWYIERALGYKRHKNGGVVIGGCGMDMAFSVVYNLGRAMYPEGFKLAENQRGRNGDKSGFDKDGGYAFKQSAM